MLLSAVVSGGLATSFRTIGMTTLIPCDPLSSFMTTRSLPRTGAHVAPDAPPLVELPLLPPQATRPRGRASNTLASAGVQRFMSSAPSVSRAAPRHACPTGDGPQVTAA